MKRICFILLCVISIVSVYADNHTVVVRGNGPTLSGNTEVSVTQDSIVVKPAVGVSAITVTVTDVTGEVLSEQVLPAQSNATVNVTTPPPSEGYTLELRDDTGLIYLEEQ